MDIMQGETLGGRIRLLRTKRGLTQEDVARQIHCGHSSYWRIETDKVEPHWSRVVAIADVLEVSLDTLAGRAHA